MPRKPVSVRPRVARYLLACALALVVATGCGGSSEQEFTAGLRSVDYARGAREVSANLWYPAPSTLQEDALTLNAIYAAEGVWDAPIAESPAGFPLLLFSHGSGGGRADLSWLASRLARRGFVVLAVEHPGNRFGDDSPEGVVTVWRRPPDLSAGIDAILKDPVLGSMIDPQRIGAVGHSSGGYAVIALAGGIYDFGRLGAYCLGPDRGPDCELAEGLDISRITDLALADDSYRDRRVRSVFALAPAVAQGFDTQGLEAIDIPVHVVGSRDDALTLFHLNAERYATLIPTAELEAVERGGHFVYLSSCTETGRVLAPQVCIDENPQTDRSGIHDLLAESAYRFFASTLD